MNLLAWLRDAFDGWEFTAKGVLVSSEADVWPLTATSFDDLTRRLQDAEMLASLPAESASLANIVEGEVRSHAIDQLKALREAGEDVGWEPGTARGYPDLEVSGACFSDDDDPSMVHAVDVKVARVNDAFTSCTNAITLYTGNTYFRYPQLNWPGVPRPFNEYASHLDVVCLYRYDPDVTQRVTRMEVVVQPPWRIASRSRSSGTREYIGAVREVARLREGRGEFDSPEEFYRYWREFPFTLSSNAEKTLRRLLEERGLDPGD